MMFFQQLEIRVMRRLAVLACEQATQTVARAARYRQSSEGAICFLGNMKFRF
jgi:hypothetical protein